MYHDRWVWRMHTSLYIHKSQIVECPVLSHSAFEKKVSH